MDRRYSREHFLALIGKVRGNGAFPDGPLLEIYDAITQALSHAKKTVQASQWTKEKPTEPGWYWWKGVFPGREAADVSMAEVYEWRSDLKVKLFLHGARYGFIKSLDGQWAGPLEAPERGEVINE